MSLWKQILLTYIVLLGFVVWVVFAAGLQFTWGQALLVLVIVNLHQRIGALAERQDAQRRSVARALREPTKGD